MKGIIKYIFLIALGAVIILSFAACNSTDDNHLHEWGEWSLKTAATCTGKGEEKRSCGINKKHVQVRTTPSLTHYFDDWKIKGDSATKICLRCNEIIDWTDFQEIEFDAKTKIGYRLINLGSEYEFMGYKEVSDATGIKEITIPSYFSGKPVTAIADNAFGSMSAFWWPSTRTFTFEEINFESGSRIERIGKSAFGGCYYLKNIIIPASCKQIDDYAFNYLRNLESVIFEEDSRLESIGSYAFDCAINIEIPDSCKSIGYDAFGFWDNLEDWPDNSVIYYNKWAIGYNGKRDSLTNLTFKEDTRGIASGAFSGYSALDRVTIPKNLMFIGENAFDRTGLSRITVDEQNSNYIAIDDVLYNKTMTELIKYPVRKEGSTFNIPHSVTKINAYAFLSNIQLENISIPETVTEIGSSAFEGCGKLQSIILPDGIEEISEKTFYQCTDLKSVILPKKLKRIGSNTFADSGLESIDIPDNCEVIEDEAFLNCSKLRSVKLPSALSTLGAAAFKKCESLESTTIPAGITKLMNNTFYDCTALRSVTINEDSFLNAIGSSVFWGCTNLESITIPAGVTIIENAAFSYCENLYSVNFKNRSKLQTIESNAFWGCTNLNNISIPDNVICMERGTFIDSGIWEKASDNGIVYVGKWAVEIKGDLGNSPIIKSDTVGIASHLFYNTEITSIKIPSSVKFICDGAFSYCFNLKEVTFEKGSKLEKMGNRVFEATIIMGAAKPGVVYVAKWAVGFKEDYDISWDSDIKYDIVLKSDTIGIADNALLFYYDRIKSLVIPKNVKYVGNIFNYNLFPDEIYFGGTIEQWKSIDKEGNIIPDETVMYFYYSDWDKAAGGITKFNSGIAIGIFVLFSFLVAIAGMSIFYIRFSKKLGGIKEGMVLEEIIEILGKPDIIETSFDVTTVIWQRWLGIGGTKNYCTITLKNNRVIMLIK